MRPDLDPEKARRLFVTLLIYFTLLALSIVGSIAWWIV